MTITDKLALFARLTRCQPEDLDPLLEPFEIALNGLGKDLAPCPWPSTLPRHRLNAPDAIAVGVLIDHPLPDPADAACRLASLAIEQDVHLVAFATLDYSGLERFGIRTERISGQTDEERRWCRDQLMQFWGIEVLVST